MDSRFNIPAPAVVKLRSDAGVENSSRLKVAVSQDDAKATAEVDCLTSTPRKPLKCSHGCPYRKPTQVGG